MTDKIVALSTCANAEEAERIGRALVDAKLAACVSIVPGVRSIYRWQGAVEDCGEWLLVIKSRRELFNELRVALEKSHSYEVPELIALPVVDGSENYLRWFEDQLRA